MIGSEQKGTLLGLISSTFHVAGGVAYWAHFGGFVVGAIIAFVFSLVFGERERETMDVEEPGDPLEPKPQEFTRLKL